VSNKKSPDPEPRRAPSASRTKEEQRQLQDLAAENPWSLTLREFLAKVEAHYGLRLSRTSAAHPQGGRMEIWYLQSEDKETTVHLPGIDLDEELDPVTTGSLCRRLGIPPEDFGLPPEEPWDEKDLDLED
jgi:hypothetical protein